MSPQSLYVWFASSWRHKLLVLAVLMVLVELALRRFARDSRLYRGWTAFFQGIGTFWTAIILGIVYLLPVGPIGLLMRLFGNDPLDRGLAPEPSFWRAHEASPLGVESAARHQF